MLAAMTVEGVLRGVEDETRHVCWQCPVCGSGVSDDYDGDLANPYPEACWRLRHHPGNKPVHVLVVWRLDEVDDSPGATADGRGR